MKIFAKRTLISKPYAILCKSFSSGSSTQKSVMDQKCFYYNYSQTDFKSLAWRLCLCCPFLDVLIKTEQLDWIGS